MCVAVNVCVGVGVRVCVNVSVGVCVSVGVGVGVWVGVYVQVLVYLVCHILAWGPGQLNMAGMKQGASALDITMCVVSAAKAKRSRNGDSDFDTYLGHRALQCRNTTPDPRGCVLSSSL
jgi:hypothetical protein